MWQLEKAEGYSNLPDVARFIAHLNRPGQAWASFFEANPTKPIFVGRAPGRLDLMGGIADYSGSLVLELPLGVATFVAAQAIHQPVFKVVSINQPETGTSATVSLSLEELLACESYEQARQMLNRESGGEWAAYLAGIWLVLVKEGLATPAGGVKLLVYSEVPEGKGVSSSAALEVATLQALSGLFGLSLAGREAALLCQRVENLVVGAPCGVMDQMTSACGEAGKLLTLLCQPAELQPLTALPAQVEVWGIDSGLRHAVSGADYSSVRVGAFMGYRIIAELAGLAVTPVQPGRVKIEDKYWRGYLANITPSCWETLYRDRLPLTMSGAEFLARYAGITDAVTQVDTERTYAVRQPTAHPIYEHHRVRLFRHLLQCQPLEEETLTLLGELMYQSHASYSQCRLGSNGTDRLVELVRETGLAGGLYGAKITGGGSGGTVAVLSRQGQREVVEELARRYYQESGLTITPLLGGSSSGAINFGVARLSLV